MMKSSCRHVSLLMMIIMVVALSSASSLEGLFNLPCCNTCPPPPVNIVPVYVEKEIVVNIPFPVLKPYPSQFFPNGTCPDGFVRPTSSSNKCVRSIRVEDNVKCPEGYFRVGDNTCVRVYIANNEDTLGQIIDKVVCPPGYIQPEDGSIACMHAETNETVSAPENIEDPLQCPEGYLRVTPWRCVKVVSCPTEGGFTVTEDGRCMRTRIDCPEGYKLLGRTQCIREELNCPTGYEYNNNTHSCDKIVYVTRCPDGQVDVNGVCKHPDCVTTECSPEVQCQKGYVWQKKNPTDCCAQCSPCVCSASFEPVCTNDNVTYPNYCVANCLKAEVKHLGACGSSDRKDDCTVDTTFVDWRPKIVCPDGYTFNAEEKSCTLVSTSTSSQTTVTTKVDKKVRPLKEIIVKALEKQQQEQSAPATESNTLSNTQTHRSRDTLHTVNTLEFEMLY